MANAEIAPRPADKCDSNICFRVSGYSDGWRASVTRISDAIDGIVIEGPNGQGGASRREPVVTVYGKGAGVVHGFGFQGFSQKSHISFRVCDRGTPICW
ncbi:hypothetical protein [Allokutzneria albata]|uniref:Uncharacterized protein n=1 Tax=Allokutzneria albata TaxID=211114 RepID=A0A1G9Y1B1_ALLAB|nr:hypothetical protein [Allokutzneria albata]SDN02869.1 hypothetical protein SAMN04489726_4537 [Allokutzneria albata]